MPTAITLYELNNIVRGVLEHSISDTYWIQAELSEVNERHGHCFLEFIQKGDTNESLIAKARGQIWASRWALLSPYFSHTTGQPLQAGMQVLVEVNITFHELYGYSLNVVDIDPTYTLGDIARKRREILQTLQEEGVDTMNKELSLPLLLNRIAVISSPTAAGYGDFCNQLKDNTYKLAFDVKLFPAIMQGDAVESSIIAALEQIASEEDRWDAVVIIRGGGAAADLSGFDTLRLAENVAQFPLPIITGIGHERDDTVIDMVSHTRVKTPTAAAEFLIQHGAEQLFILDDCQSELKSQLDKILSTEIIRLQMITQKLPALVASYHNKENTILERINSALSTTIISKLTEEKGKMELFLHRLDSSANLAIHQRQNILDNLTTRIESSDPKRILKLGFSITRVNGKAITTTKNLSAGTTIETTLADGIIHSTITDKKQQS